MIARQSTALELAIGPVLDADGVAVTDCVVGDFKIKKTTGNFAALNASATLTHVSAGMYDLVLTTSDTDTVGLATIAIDDTVNACAPVRMQVIEEAVYDALFAASANAFTGAAGSSQLSAIADGAITAAKFGAGAITAAVIATGAIDADAIADNAIDAGAIASGAITNAKFASGAITADTIADAAIDAATFAAGAITAAAIATGAIDADAIADDAIDAGAIASGAITAAKIADGAIDSATFASGTTIPRCTLVDTTTTNTDIGVAGAGLTAADDAVIAAIAALNNLSAAQVNEEVLDVVGTDALVAGVSIKEALRRQGAMLSGKVTNAGTGTETFKDYADSVSTIVITVDSSGNRSAITYN